MDFFNTDLVRPLHIAENIFLEVLLTNFTLTRSDGAQGVELRVSFRKDSPAVWNREGRGTIKNRMRSNLDGKVCGYKQQLDSILLSGKAGTFSPDDPEFLWRWASAGTLPIISLGDSSYYCFFYRDIFPIGWNIANGATDTSAELLDPLQALERELGEELVVASPTKGARYVLRPSEDQSLDRAAFGNFRRLWKERFPAVDLLSYKIDGLAFKWEDGPDRIFVNSDFGKRELSECFVNINSADFGIELDRVARIAITDDFVLCDGEASEGRVLNRPVGLFEVQKFQKAHDDGLKTFVPDKFFYSGLAYDGSQFKQLLEGDLTDDVKSWRSAEIIKAFERAAREETNLGLCPVTNTIVRRHSSYIKKLSSEARDFSKLHTGEVFICFAALDKSLAEHVYDFITQKANKTAFFSPRSLPGHPGLWNEPIYAALRAAKYFVAVATDPEHLRGEWAQFEMLVFHQLHTHKRMTSVVSGFDPRLLPDPLLFCEAITCDGVQDLSDCMQRLGAWLTR